MKNFIFEYRGHVYNVVKNKWFSVYENGKFITKVKNLKNLKPPIVKQKVKNCVYVTIKASYKGKSKGHNYDFSFTLKIDKNKINEDELSEIIEDLTDDSDYFFTIVKKEQKKSIQQGLYKKDFEIGFSQTGKEGFTGDNRFKNLEKYLKWGLREYVC